MLAIGFGMVAVPVAQADHPSEDTWLSVHDTEDGPDSDHTEGSVDCLFWVRGYNLPFVNGTLTALTTGRFGARTEEFGEWIGTPDGNGTYSLDVGPFEILQSGDRWTVIAGMYDESGEYHAAFSPFFSYNYCTTDGDETSIAPPPDCPSGVTVEATNDDNRLAWQMSTDHDGAFRVYRDGDLLATVGGTERTYLDTDVEAGATHAYRVTATHGPRESQDCGSVSITSVPFFGGPIGIALAALGSIGIVAMLLRRK